ncbi:MAG: DUF2854 domain-containing protein [Cyanobacteriota bacterium]|nr:DUF2854 domain-containing protein [Cyanobacteriota bacterium]
MFRQFSLGSFGLVVGGSLTLMGIVTYFLSINPTLDLIGLFYGTPILLGGFALKAAELKPVPFSKPTSPDILALREQQATSTLNQIRKDVTRYRYGQEVHLDESLQRFGLSPTDEERPVLRAIREEEIEGCYALVLEFESPFMSLEKWQQQQEKIERFFGPGIRAAISYLEPCGIAEPKPDWIEVALIVLPPSSS